MTDSPATGETARRVEEIVHGLYHRQPENRIEARLHAVREVCDLLGDPQHSYGVVHITGTNGKSSTARIAASILRSYGLHVGLFTSPHLVRFNERIELGGEPISDTKLVEIWDDIAPFIEIVDKKLLDAGEARLTFFETLTVLAFAAFADAPVDVAVIEVGLGGEWDSTNVADGQVAVFAPIALDHMEILGDTIGQIAHTKAGIIKDGALVVTAEQVPEAMAELEAAADRHGAVIKRYGVDFEAVDILGAVGGQQVTIRGIAGTYPELLLPLLGEYQAENAALAVAAVECFLGGGETPLALPVLEEGLLHAVSPGRLQRIGSTTPTVIVDVAHNPHGARSLAESLGDAFGFSTTIGVVGILREKDASSILTILESIFDQVVITASKSPRAIAPDALAALAVKAFGADRVVVADSVEDALNEARELVDDAADPASAGIVVTGSVTTVGEAVALVDAGWANPSDRDSQDA